MPSDATQPEEDAVQDVRRIRERLLREAGGDVNVLAERAHRVAEEYREKLGLRRPGPAHPIRPTVEP